MRAPQLVTSQGTHAHGAELLFLSHIYAFSGFAGVSWLIVPYAMASAL